MKKGAKRITAAILAALILSGTAGLASMVSGIQQIALAAEEETVAIDETNFPDENFREVVKNQADKNGDGLLTPEERQSVKTLAIKYFDLDGQVKSYDIIIPAARTKWYALLCTGKSDGTQSN